MGRPVLKVRPRYFQLKLALRPGEDDDLIAWLDALPARGRARAVVTALRAGGVVVGGNADADVDEDAALDALDALFM